MTADEVDVYLAWVEEPKRSTLEALRRSILAAVPDADEGISFGADCDGPRHHGRSPG